MALAHKKQIGQFDEWIAIQEPTVVTGDANSDMITGWDYIDSPYELPAEVNENPGGEEFQANRLTGIQNVVFEIRYDNRITVLMRIVWRTRVYQIKSIAMVGRNAFLKIIGELNDNEIVT
jgi:SPP1 family predicted phage head-tail adaptor